MSTALFGAYIHHSHGSMNAKTINFRMCTMPSALLGTKNVLLSIQNREIENLISQNSLLITYLIERSVVIERAK